MTLTKQRRHVMPEPDETMEQLIARVFPGESIESATENVKSWNLHIYMRRPPGVLLGSDIVFIEPPVS